MAKKQPKKALKKVSTKPKPDGYVFGRPSLYQGELTIKKVEEYIAECNDEQVSFVKQVTAKGSKIYETRLRVRIPTIDGLARRLAISRPTIYEWQEKYPDFSYVLEQLLTLQAERLSEGGLGGTYNPTISKLLLHKHGYVDKLETDNKHKGDVKLSALYDAVAADK